MLVLCVDDDPDALRRAAAELASTLPGGEVITVGSASTAFAALDSEPVDCVVCGDELPDGDGIEFLREVRDRDPELPFVLFGGSGTENEALAAGATAFVRKDGADPYATLASYLERVADDPVRKQTERDVLDAIDDAVFVYDPETDDADDFRRRLCEFWDYPYRRTCEADGDAENCCRAVELASDGAVEDALRSALEEGELRTEWRCETDEGTTAWAGVRLTAATIDGDECVVALVHDRTADRRRETDLETFGEVVEHAGHAIYITDTDGTIEYVNPAFEETTGYSAREAIGEDPSILKSGEHDEEFYRELWETILDGEVWRSEVVNRRKNGEKYVIRQTIAPVTDDAGDVDRFVAINDEITEQKRYEERLRVLNEATRIWMRATSRGEVGSLVVGYARNVLEFDLVAVYLHDETADVLVPEAAAGGDVGVTAADLPEFAPDSDAVRHAFGSNVGTVDDAGSIPELEASLEGTSIEEALLCSLDDHGIVLVGREGGAGFGPADRSIAKIVAATVTEVLDRIDRERELKAQRDRIEELAGIVSHDLRNPLAIAKGNVDLARELDDEAAFERIEEAHDRMERIIDDLLVLSRQGESIRSRQPVELSNVVDEAWSNVETGTATMRMVGDALIEADDDRLLRLFENLFRNAVEHGSTNSDSQARDEELVVRVGLLDDDGFYVEDTGPGVPPDERDRIFEPGYSTSNDTGFGLSIVRTVVETHGWSVDVTKSPEGGLRFEIRDVTVLDENTTPRRPSDGPR